MSEESMTATSANRQFSTVLRKVEEGNVIEVTNHGRVVAYVVPAAAFKPNRAAAKERLLDYFRNKPGIEIQPWTRDELYEDDE